MSTYIGLYYPYFHFPGDEWVVFSALYWDKLARIVPRRYPTRRDSQLVKELSQEGGFIFNFEPGYAELQSVTEPFVALIDANRPDLQKHYGLEHAQEWPDNEYTIAVAPEGSNQKLAYVNIGKLDPGLISSLFEHNLATPINPQDYQWIGMHPKLANVYMSALAEVIAERGQASPLAIDVQNYFAVGGLTFERLSQVLLDEADLGSRSATAAEAESVLAMMSIKAVMPKDIRKISAEQIMRIREKRSGEMGKFHQFLKGIVAGLDGLEKIQLNKFLRYHLEVEYDRQIKPSMDELEESLRSLGIDVAHNVFTLDMKVPALLTSLGIAMVNPYWGITSAAALGLGKILADTRKRMRTEIKNSDVAYLWYLQQDLTPANSVQGLLRNLRRLFIGT
jgi:hypothetical protein